MTTQFFAVPDPAQPEVMTYWRRDESGMLQAWPKHAIYGPRPDGVFGRSTRELLRLRRWRDDHWTPWRAQIEAAIEAEPGAAAARFSRLTVRCGVCGRKLTDATSRNLGIGPDCRAEA